MTKTTAREHGSEATSIASEPKEAVTPRSEDPIVRLDRAQFWGFFAIALTIFLFSTGPVWRHPWQMDALNTAILYSYLPLPVMVALGLAWKRRLGARAFFLDTLELTLLKYSVTFAIALVLWGASPAPPPRSAATTTRAPHPAAPAERAPAPTPISPERTGRLEGVVVDASGQPLEGALVFVNDGSGISPRLAVAQLHQPILARATDGQMHTLVAEQDHATLFNVPLLGSGATSPVRVTSAHGQAALRCSVHQHTANESSAHLAILAHPFFTITAKDGRFRWEGVPAGALRVAAWDRARGEASLDVRLAANGTADARLVLAAARVR